MADMKYTHDFLPITKWMTRGHMCLESWHLSAWWHHLGWGIGAHLHCRVFVTHNAGSAALSRRLGGVTWAGESWLQCTVVTRIKGGDSKWIVVWLNMSRISCHDNSGDTDLRISVTYYALSGLGRCETLCHTCNGQPHSSCVFSVFSDLSWLNDILTVSHPQPPVGGGRRWRWWCRLSRGCYQAEPLYLSFNQKQWCTIYLCPVSLSSGPCNDHLGRGEALVTDPATNYRSFTLTTQSTSWVSWPVTTHHRPGDPGSWDTWDTVNTRHRRHRTETLGMQTPHRNPEYSSDIQM